MDKVPKLVVYGATCFFWDDIEKAGSKNGIPCCPHCEGMLFQTETEKWLESAKGYNQISPEYLEMLQWGKGKCFTDRQEAMAAYQYSKKTQVKVVRKFKDLPLGTRFRYQGDSDTFVILGRSGNGCIAKWHGVDGPVQFQEVFSAAESSKDLKTLEVEIAES